MLTSWETDDFPSSLSVGAGSDAARCSRSKGSLSWATIVKRRARPRTNYESTEELKKNDWLKTAENNFINFTIQSTTPNLDRESRSQLLSLADDLLM